MNKQHKDITDDEIRVISSSPTQETQSHNPKRHYIWWLVSFLATTIIIIVIYFLVSGTSDAEQKVAPTTGKSIPTVNEEMANQTDSHGYVSVKDTVVDDVKLRIFTPDGLSPSLFIGPEIVKDPSVKMLFPAADIRKDNGEIVGAFVLNGDLKSKGQSKAGFCSIIRGKITIGVADATPMLEQALESNGDFFRQYPLVVGGQVVENKPKGKSQRKALAEINGQVAVVTTENRLTFHDFSQCLSDLGVTNAIYLIGSLAYGFAIDQNGNKIEVGNPDGRTSFNTNYIVWK